MFHTIPLHRRHFPATLKVSAIVPSPSKSFSLTSRVSLNTALSVPVTPVITIHWLYFMYKLYICHCYSCVTHQQLIHKLVMASILSLTDDCLLRILSFFDDPFVFHCFILTCQRFYHVSKNANSVLQLKVIPLFCTAHPLLRITLLHPRWRRFFLLARKQ